MNNPKSYNSNVTRLRYAVVFVASANLLYFFVEFNMAKHIGSVSLYADSIDFLEDTAVNSIVLISLFFSSRIKHMVSILLAFLLLVPITAAFFTAWEKFVNPLTPASDLLSLTAFGALLVNITCAFVLAKSKNDGGSLSKAAFLSSRNDAIANIAMLLAAFSAMIWPSFWPDLLVGIGIALINLDSAKEILETTQQERRS